MERYICIHAHLYQPPRENPWLEAIELQDSAYPYHDWNERITAECYGPNSASRILDEDDRIVRIVNNYSKISFNFGPTLLSWLEEHSPAVYAAILAADQESARRFSGHGSAMAQAYNHPILPLANLRDVKTQVRWGVRDFEYRFGRKPEGMWLPETAVDVASLEALAAEGIRYTVLSPYQARRVRKTGARAWRDATDGGVDPTHAYRVQLPSGRSLAVFFYDGPVSRAVAFEGLLHKGEHFAGRLAGAFDDGRTWPQLVHIATDGETYGHHHHRGDMALAYALHHIEDGGLARLTNYGEYLERHPPTHDAEIVERTAWSCAHGVGRWEQDCGCSSGGHPGWNQAWRGPLRAALDWLRDALAPLYEARGGELFRNPWEARDAYIDVVLDRSPESRDRFLARHAARELSEAERLAAWKLLEMQRHAMLMYTSCGWFFDELSGIETVQVIQYAGRAIQLSQEVFPDDVEPAFLELLARAKSNLHDPGDGAAIYGRFVKPAMVDLLKVAAHHAISSLFDGDADRSRIYCYSVDRHDARTLHAGKAKLVIGRGQLTSEITQESAELSFGVLHMGDHNLNGGVRAYRGEEAYEALLHDAEAAFRGGDMPAVIRLMDRHFGESNYTLKSLFRDEQRRIVELILESTLAETTAMFRQIYQHNASLMRFLGDLGVPLPKPLRASAEFLVNAELRQIFAAEDPDLARARALLDVARQEQVPLDAAGLAYTLQRRLERMLERLHAEPADLGLMRRVVSLLGLVDSLPFDLNLWKAQNLYYQMTESGSARPQGVAETDQRSWDEQYGRLGESLGIRSG